MNDLDSALSSIRALIKGRDVTIVTAVQVCSPYRESRDLVSWEPTVVTIDYANNLSPHGLY